jgi:hypothetical protein
MTSLFTLTWRRGFLSNPNTTTNNNNDATEKQERDQHLTEPDSPVPPCVTASHSNETWEEPPSPPYLKIPVHAVPVTPEGLKPRPNISTLRRELNIQYNNGADPETTAEGLSFALPPRPTRSMTVSSSWSWPGMGMPSSSYPMSPEATDDNVQQFDGVAESPRLIPGRALTAVGALVASYCTLDPAYKDHHHQHVTESRDVVSDMHTTISDDEDDVEKDGNFLYQSLNFSMDVVNTPKRNCAKRSLAHIPSSPLSAHSSIAVSPSSQPSVTSRLPAVNESFQSGSHKRLLPPINKNTYDFSALGYNYGPQEGTEVVWGDHDTFVSGMSQSHQHVTTTESVLDDSYGECLMQRKQCNQRRQKEELLMEAFERLQDNMHAIQVKGVDMNLPSLLNGFSRKSRETIVRNLSAILNELEIAQPEEFLMSPSHMPEYTQSHEDLRQALSLCLSFCHMSVTTDDFSTPLHDHWVLLPEVQIALGLIKPDYTSPVSRRGGDTSVFSLPSDSNATPMTSNVSLSSTITTAKTLVRPDGIALSQTIQDLAMTLEFMSSACRNLSEWSSVSQLEPTASIRVMNQLKKSYKKLLDISVDDLKTLIDAFELRHYPRDEPILRQVSEDSEGSGIPIAPCPANDIRMHRSGGHGRSNNTGVSPCTWDMQSSTYRYVEDDQTDIDDDDDDAFDGYEDLRRQMGSSDYDDACVTEYRDGPEDCRE